VVALTESIVGVAHCNTYSENANPWVSAPTEEIPMTKVAGDDK
jgi:hypothetical protein